jgi:diguanylate cyclase (GGDEF)-like protein
MDSKITRRRRLIAACLIVSGVVCVAALWAFEASVGLLTSLDAVGYPILLSIFSLCAVVVLLLPRWQTHAEYVAYTAFALYFIVSLQSFTLLRDPHRIYIIANTLQWMPVLYVAAFVLFHRWQPVIIGGVVFALSLLASLVPMLLHGGLVWDTAVAALLINAYMAHFLMLLSLSLVAYMNKRFDHVSAHARLMEDAAYTDGLTGVANRRGMERLLSSEGVSLVQPVALLLFDLDHFKRINDQFGHVMGDEVLVRAAQLIKNQLRATDTVYRWGGEEFLVVANATTLEAGQGLAERVRQAVAASSHPVAGAMTVSAGVRSWAGELRLADALRLADEALYRAKSLGRNQVVTA